MKGTITAKFSISNLVLANYLFLIFLLISCRPPENECECSLSELENKSEISNIQQGFENIFEISTKFNLHIPKINIGGMEIFISDTARIKDLLNTTVTKTITYNNSEVEYSNQLISYLCGIEKSLCKGNISENEREKLSSRYDELSNNYTQFLSNKFKEKKQEETQKDDKIINNTIISQLPKDYYVVSLIRFTDDKKGKKEAVKLVKKLKKDKYSDAGHFKDQNTQVWVVYVGRDIKAESTKDIRILELRNEIRKKYKNYKKAFICILPK